MISHTPPGNEDILMESEVRATLVSMYKEGKIDAGTAMQMMADAANNTSENSSAPHGGPSTHPKRKREASPDQDDDKEVDDMVEGATGLDSLILLTQHFVYVPTWSLMSVNTKSIMRDNYSSSIMQGVAYISIININTSQTMIAPCPATGCKPYAENKYVSGPEI